MILLAALGAIQFIRPARNENERVSGTDIAEVYKLPGTVHALLENSCYDCHSNHTRYPWYTNVQPFGWWLASHINDGKAELNFTEFGNYSARRQQSKFKAIKTVIEDNSMPLSSYTFVHPKAKFSKNEKELILSWVEQTRASLSKN